MMQFNPMFIKGDNNSSGFMLSQSTKLKDNKYLFSDIVKVLTDKSLPAVKEGKNGMDEHITLGNIIELKPVAKKELKIDPDKMQLNGILNLLSMLPGELKTKLNIHDNNFNASQKVIVDEISLDKSQVESLSDLLLHNEKLLKGISGKNQLLINAKNGKSELNIKISGENPESTKGNNYNLNITIIKDVPEFNEIINKVGENIAKHYPGVNKKSFGSVLPENLFQNKKNINDLPNDETGKVKNIPNSKILPQKIEVSLFSFENQQAEKTEGSLFVQNKKNLKSPKLILFKTNNNVIANKDNYPRLVDELNNVSKDNNIASIGKERLNKNFEDFSNIRLTVEKSLPDRKQNSVNDIKVFFDKRTSVKVNVNETSSKIFKINKNKTVADQNFQVSTNKTPIANEAEVKNEIPDLENKDLKEITFQNRKPVLNNNEEKITADKRNVKINGDLKSLNETDNTKFNKIERKLNPGNVQNISKSNKKNNAVKIKPEQNILTKKFNTQVNTEKNEIESKNVIVKVDAKVKSDKSVKPVKTENQIKVENRINQKENKFTQAQKEQVLPEPVEENITQPKHENIKNNNQKPSTGSSGKTGVEKNNIKELPNTDNSLKDKPEPVKSNHIPEKPAPQQTKIKIKSNSKITVSTKVENNKPLKGRKKHVEKRSVEVKDNVKVDIKKDNFQSKQNIKKSDNASAVKHQTNPEKPVEVKADKPAVPNSGKFNGSDQTKTVETPKAGKKVISTANNSNLKNSDANANANKDNHTNGTESEIPVINKERDKNNKLRPDDSFNNILKTKEISHEKIVHKTTNAKQPEKLVKTHELIKNLTDFIGKHEKNTLTVSIDPKELGKLKIKLETLNNNNVKAHIKVDNIAVKQAIESNLNELFSNLSKSGVQLSSVNISLNDSFDRKAKQEHGKKKVNNVAGNSEEINPEKDDAVKMMGYNTYEYLV